MATDDLVDFRCPVCKRLIFKVSPASGIEVEVKCPKHECGELVRMRLEDDND